MGLWAAAGRKGLWQGAAGNWRRVDAPPYPMRVAVEGDRMVCACAGGEVFDPLGQRLLTACPGVEAMALQGPFLYLLSGEADSVACCRWASGELCYLNPAGVYPRDLRADPGGKLLAVAGGAAGQVLVMNAPALKLLAAYPAPGVVSQVCFVPEGLAVLTAVEEGQIITWLGIISPRRRSFQKLLQIPGLPGALCLCGDGTLALATSERLLKVRLRPLGVLWQQHRLGLPVCLQDQPQGLLISDGLTGGLSLLPYGGREKLIFESEDMFAQGHL